MNICIDFDGTCVKHEFPKVGEDCPGAVETLKELVEEGHGLILFTMRSDGGKNKFLTDAVNWFEKNNIELYGIQENPTQKTWTTSPKAFGQLYIDDAALGCPLIYPLGGDRPFVDWKQVGFILKKSKVL